MLERTASPIFHLVQALTPLMHDAVRLVNVLAWPFQSVTKAYRRKRTIDSLRGLDARTLADIGVERNRIEFISKTVIDHPSVDPRRLFPRD